MGVVVYLYQGSKRIVALADPAGGSFDAAGDFDRVLPEGDAAFPLLGRVDPYDDTEFPQSAMPELISDIDRLLPTAQEGPEQRGLLRLRAMAERCAHTADGSLVFIGD
jgi:hypothetical protein